MATFTAIDVPLAAVARVSRVRIGAVVGGSSFGFEVLGTLQARDVTVYSALKNIVTVGATGYAEVTGVQTERPFAGNAAQWAFECTGGGTLIVSDAVIDYVGSGNNSSGAHVDGLGSYLACQSVIFRGMSEGGNPTWGFVAEGTSSMILTGCTCTDAVSLDLQVLDASLLQVNGGLFTTKSCASAAAGSVLPDSAGQATITNGTSTVTVTAATVGGAAYGILSKPAQATLNEADGVITVVNAVWVANDLVINTSAVTTDNRTVGWSVKG